MNQYQISEKQRAALNTIKSSNRVGAHTGCIKLSTANTWEHELRKVQVVWELMKRGHEIMTETIFTNGSRADVVCLDRQIIYEVLHTETLEEAKKKRMTYPSLFEIRFVRTADTWRPELLD